jgi:hypothetical protein
MLRAFVNWAMVLTKRLNFFFFSMAKGGTKTIAHLSIAESTFKNDYLLIERGESFSCRRGGWGRRVGRGGDALPPLIELGSDQMYSKGGGSPRVRGDCQNWVRYLSYWHLQIVLPGWGGGEGGEIVVGSP